MWIVPKNFSGTYPFVQGIQDLGLDSNEFCQLCERSLMSKSKPTLFKTWLTRWNKDSYLQHLCTQTLKPSHSQTFVDAWTSYLVAFPASPLAKPEQEDQQKTHGISSLHCRWNRRLFSKICFPRKRRRNHLLQNR